jgi:hypothetical protein
VNGVNAPQLALSEFFMGFDLSYMGNFLPDITDHPALFAIITFLNRGTGIY